MDTPDKVKNGFGTFKGVIVPNITMMLGIILFLRLGLVLGNVGLWQFFVIIAVSLTIMIITALSIAMIVTNMKVGSGGVYYLISRSLGIEIGGAIGIALVAAQVICMIFCVAGFAYSFNAFFPQYSIELIELGTLIFLAFVSFVSTNVALKTQALIFGVLLVAIGSIFLGPIASVPESGAPYFPVPLSFWQGFAIFYPALTGIEAGMALSGSLRNPARSLSYGNVVSLVAAALIYTAIALFLWATYSQGLLASNPAALLDYAKVPIVIYIGIWCAALSSALGNFIGAPRILQKIAEDNIVPEIFSRSYGRHQEPRIAHGLIFFVASALVLTTTIDQILPILSMICLLTYGTLNLVGGLAELINGPSWRPSFRIPWQYPIFGALACFSIMFMISPLWSFISFICIIGLYIFLRNRTLEVSFEDIRESILIFFSRQALYRLSKSSESPKNWLPQILVVSKSTVQHHKMIHLAHEITGNGILTIVTLLPEGWGEAEESDRTAQFIDNWLEEEGITGFSEVQSFTDYYNAICHQITLHGLGPLQPNTLFLPIQEDDDSKGILSILETGLQQQKNLLFFFDSSSSENTMMGAIQKPKNIAIWWDPLFGESFDLILTILFTLRTRPQWKQKDISLHIPLSDSSAKKHLESYFRTLLKKIRLRCKLQFYFEDEAPHNLVNKHSANTDLIFFPLRPETAYKSREEYEGYIGEFLEKFHASPVPILGVACQDNIKHKEIYLPEGK